MQHIMRIPSPTLGDQEVTWDPTKPETVKHAQEQFDVAVKEGKLAYTVKREGTTGQAMPGEQITEFDPSLGEIIFVAPKVGG